MTQLDHVSPLIQWLPIAFRIVSKLPNTVFKVLHDHQAPASPVIYPPAFKAYPELV